MGEKAIISTLIGFVLIVICGIVSFIDYVLYLVQASFIGRLAGLGAVLGIVFFILGMVGLYGDN